MPEGDTVWNTARLLHRALAGTRLSGAELRVPALATTDLTGWQVIESVSRGKHLLLRLGAPGDDERHTLHSHLRMDGAWRTYAPGQRWTGGPGHEIRAVLRAPRAVAVGYHLHELALVPTGDEERIVGRLGPDPLGDDWDVDEVTRRLLAEPETAVGEALLDQTKLAGVGNLYRCEALFLRGLSPWTPVGEVPEPALLAALAGRLLVANRGRWTQSSTGSLRRGETTYVHGRRGRPCRRCGTPIRVAEQGERITYWCPACQPAR